MFAARAPRPWCAGQGARRGALTVCCIRRPITDKMKTEARLGALEGAMAAAVRDYTKELEAEESKKQAKVRAFNEKAVDLLADDDADDDLEELQKQRIKEMKAEAMRRQEEMRRGHGSYAEVEEKRFLEEVTMTEHVVCHFFHPDFERCKVVDKHMSAVCRKYLDTKFIKVNATEAPFFVTKLQIQMLPCIIMFRKGIAIDRIVGFEELGGTDDFSQLRLEKRLSDKGSITYKRDDIDSDEEEEMSQRKNVKGGGLYSGSKYSRVYKSNDDDDDDDW